MRRLTASAVLAAAILGLPACSIDGVGAASSEVFEADGARVVRTETYGVVLRTAAEDAGITVGYTSTLALIPDCPNAPRAGVYPFGVSLAGLRPVALVRRTGGFAIDTNRRLAGFMLGFAEDGFFAEVPASQSIQRHLTLTTDDPSQSRFRQISGNDPCT